MEGTAKKTSMWERTNVTNLLRNRASGKYYARVKVGGKQKWRSLDTTVATVAKLRLPEAQKALREQSMAANGKMLPGSAPGDQFKVARFIGMFIARLEDDRQMQESSKARVKDTIKTLVKIWPELSERDVRRLTTADCQAWATKALKEGSGFVAPNAKTKREGMSASGFNKCVDALRGILELAKDEGALYKNPATEVGKLKSTKKVFNLPTTAEFESITKIVATAGSRWSENTADLVRLLAFSGARLREATRLRWAHLDETKGILSIPGTKSDASKNRPLPLNPSLSLLLKEIRARRGPEAASKPIARVGSCMNSLRRACEKVGVKRLDHHDLRHYFATRCIESGVDIPTVSKWLGHSDGGVLAMQTYGHLRQEHSIAQAAKVSF
jgi:integrase